MQISNYINFEFYHFLFYYNSREELDKQKKGLIQKIRP